MSTRPRQNCMKCGRSLPQDAGFCPNCGTAITDSSLFSPQPASSEGGLDRGLGEGIPTLLPGSPTVPLKFGDIPFQPGQQISPRYTILKMLGVGGMGAVYQAFDSELGVAVAIKVIRPGAS